MSTVKFNITSTDPNNIISSSWICYLWECDQKEATSKKGYHKSKSLLKNKMTKSEKEPVPVSHKSVSTVKKKKNIKQCLDF